MTAGRGIVHSERSGDLVRASGGTVFGFQSWIALPLRHEETKPGFQHLAAADIPKMEGEGATLRLIAGSLHGLRSPTRTFSDLFNADVALKNGASFAISAEHVERAVYVVSGAIEIAGQTGSFRKDQLVVFKPGAEIVLRTSGAARLMVLGGEPLSEQRHIYWNFVSSSKARLGEIDIVKIDCHHALGPALFHFDGIESGVAADIEDRHTSEVLRNSVLKPLPFRSWIVAQEVIWRGLHTRKRKVVKPWT